VLIVLSGLPGVGKTTIAHGVARAIGGVHVRIDAIEQTLRAGGLEVYDEGYRIGYVVAADNLGVGRLVVADSVNPWPLTRAAWRGVAERAGVRALEVEIVCSDAAAHRRRVESRAPEGAGHRLPTWAEVLAHDYRAWEGERLVVDTARSTVDESVLLIREAARA
jgi:predicted kinase